MTNDIIETAEMFHYDTNKGKRVVVKDCEIVNNFFFSKNDFYLLRKNRIFYVCISVKGNLILVWYHPEHKNGEQFYPSDIISEFRKGYIKAGIAQEDIDSFLTDPVKYEKNRRK